MSGSISPALGHLREQAPDSYARFVALGQSVFAPGALSTHVKELIAVAAAHVTRCQACIEIHTRKAREAGATEAELAEAAFVAVYLSAGGAIAQYRATHRAIQGVLASEEAPRQQEHTAP